MRNTKAKRVTPNKAVAYSPETHRLLQANYQQRYLEHKAAQESANESLRILRSAEKSLARAANEYIECTQMQFVLTSDRDVPPDLAGAVAGASYVEG